MENIALRIVTDSTCDLLPADVARLGVIVAPLTVHFTDASYRDGVDITNAEFYDKLEAATHLPSTSMVPPGDFTKIFEDCVAAGDEVFGLFISSDISGTYHSACIARESFSEDQVVLLDSRSASLSLGLLVHEAVKLRDAGRNAKEIAAEMAPLTKRIRFFTAMNTLKYLRKGGRVSATSAIMGEMLGIKPVVSIIDGKVQPIGKSRGMNAAIAFILQEAKRNLPSLNHSIVFAHSDAPELMHRAIERMKAPLKLQTWLCGEVGATIGTHGGRGCVGFAYIAE